MCLAQGPQHGEAGTRGPSVLSQALYHWATALPLDKIDWLIESIYNGNTKYFAHKNITEL